MKKANIKALILDYGGVISEWQRRENVENMLQILGRDDDGFQEVYQGKRESYDAGQITAVEYWKHVLQHYGLVERDVDMDRLIREDVKSWTELNESMLDFIWESRALIHKLAIISNMTWDTLAYMQTNYRWLELFDEMVFSCEIGINKPDRRIYEICSARLGLAPAECLFVDDSLANVEGARRAGMHAIHFKSFSEFSEEIGQFPGRWPETP